MRAVKDGIKKLFAAVGVDIRRVNPADGNFGWLAPYRIATVIDVGANAGQFAGEIHAILPEAMIYSFEPLPDCFDALGRTMRDVANFRAFPYALGECDADVEMHRSAYSPASSLLPVAQLLKDVYPHAQSTRAETVTVRTLDGVMADLEIVGGLLVKMDVQGTEDKVILGGRETLARTAVVITETSFQELYEGQSLFATIHDQLSPLGFQFAGMLGPQRKNPADGSVLQADAIFVNPARRVGAADG